MTTPAAAVDLSTPPAEPALQLCSVADVAPQRWRNGGGETRELLAWPQALDWRLRLSVADVAQDGPFSPFPGVQRWFVVLSGEGVVLTPGHQGEPPLTLRAGDAPHVFDGAAAPGCALVAGPTRDLNLMLRMPTTGRLWAAETDWDPGLAPVDNPLRPGAPLALRAVFALDACRLTTPTETHALPPLSLAWQAAEDGSALPPVPWRVSADGAAPRAWWIELAL